MNLPPPSVKCIMIQYEDGSIDEIEHLPETDCSMPLYGWTRMRPDNCTPSRAFTRQAIAALLFQTALARHLSEYDLADPKTRKLIMDHANT